MSNQGPSQQDFDDLIRDHQRLRVLFMSVIPMIGILLERQGADPAAVKAWSAASPGAAFDASQWLNAGIKLMKQLREQEPG